MGKDKNKRSGDGRWVKKQIKNRLWAMGYRLWVKKNNPWVMQKLV
jgi:hypothetical protein